MEGLDFDFTAIILNALISAICLFILGFVTKRTLGLNAGKVISFIKNMSVIMIPFLIFYLQHLNSPMQALIDYPVFLLGYLPSVFTAFIGMIIGDMVGMIGATVESEYV
jgi:hypothetical protein